MLDTSGALDKSSQSAWGEGNYLVTTIHLESEASFVDKNKPYVRLLFGSFLNMLTYLLCFFFKSFPVIVLRMDHGTPSSC